MSGLHPADEAVADPPLYDDTSERCVLGTLLSNPAGTVALVGPQLDPALFFSPPCRAMFEAAAALLAADAPLDTLTLTQAMRERGELENVGGPYEVSRLATEYGGAGVPSYAEYHLNRMREQAARRLASQAGRRGAERAEGHGASTAELIAELDQTAAAMRALCEGGRSGALPAIEDAATLLSEPADEPRELVAGLLHQGAKMVAGGGSKSFKTWVLMALAVSVATGTDFLGFTTSPGRVLYINLEIQRGFFRKRLVEITRAKGIELAAGMLDVWNLRGFAADLSKLIKDILAGAGQHYVLIVIDPIYKVLGGRDENAAGEIGTLLNELERLAVQSGAAVVFGAHFSKGNQAAKESIDRIGGSGVFARDPDTILVLTRHEEEEAFTVETTLRNHPPLAPFVVRWQFPLMQPDGTLDPAKLKQVGGKEKKYHADELLAVLGDAEVTYSAWQAAAKEHAGMGLTTFKSLRRELLDSGRVHHSKIDQLYSKVGKVGKVV